MTWDPAISRKINVAFEADDVAEFVRSLRKLPEYMRYKDGTDLWMWRAAIDGKDSRNNKLPNIMFGVLKNMLIALRMTGK